MYVLPTYIHTHTYVYVHTYTYIQLSLCLYRLKEHDPSLSSTVTSTPSTLIASSISSSLLARHSPEGDGEEEPVSMTTLVPSKSPSGVTESGHLRQMISDLSFKLSQLQHQTDTVQREKSAIQKAANQNERLLRSTIDRSLYALA